MKKNKKNTQPKSQKKQMSANQEFAIALSIIVGAVLILLGFVYLPGIIEKWKRADIVEIERMETCIITEDGIKFYTLEPHIEAISKTGLYGELNEVDYYYITNMGKKGDTPEFIVEHFNNSSGFVYRREDVEEITLKAFHPVSADICSAGSDYPVDYFIAPDEYLDNGGNSRNDEKYITMIIDALTNGEEVDPPLKQDSLWQIKLKSQNYPGLYFNIHYVTDENGISYLYNPVDRIFVSAPDELKVRIEG